MNCTITKHFILLNLFAVAAFSESTSGTLTYKKHTNLKTSIYADSDSHFDLSPVIHTNFSNKRVDLTDNCAEYTKICFNDAEFTDTSGTPVTDTLIFPAEVKREPVNCPLKKELLQKAKENAEVNNSLQKGKEGIKEVLLRKYTAYNKDLMQSVSSSEYFLKIKQLVSFTDSGRIINLLRDIQTEQLRKPFVIKDASGSLFYETSPSIPDTMFSFTTKQLKGEADAYVFGIPFHAFYTYQGLNGSQMPTFNQSLYGAKFNKEGYVDKLKSFIPGFNADKLLQNKTEFWTQLKQKGEQLLKKEVKEIESKYKGIVDSELTVYALENVYEKDMQAFTRQLINPEHIKEVATASELYNNLRYKQNAGYTIDTNLLRQSEKVLLKNKAIQEIVAKVAEQKIKWEQSGIAKKLKEEQLLNVNRLKEIAKNPKSILNEAQKYVNLSGIQRFFLKFNHLNLGQAGVDCSALTFNNILNNGISGDILGNKNKYFSFLAGVQNNFQSLFDRQFNEPLTGVQNNSFGIRMGKGDIERNYSHLSMMYFKQTGAGNLNYSFVQPERKAIVATMSNRLDLGYYGHVELEVSKSSGGFEHSINASDSSKASLQQFLATENFFENLAYSIKYEGDFEKYDLNTQFYIASAAQGYDNPGSPLLQRGSKEAAIGLKKAFFKRTLQISIKGNLREYQFGQISANRWLNQSMFVDIRWKFNKGKSISLRYQPNQFKRIENGIKYTSNSTNRLTTDVQLSGKVFRKSYHTSLNASFLNNRIALTQNSLTQIKTLLITGLQTLNLGDKLLTLNVSYSYVHNPTNYVFLNPIFNCDAGTSYVLFKKIAASSSVGYTSSENWYRQLSLKQSISGQIDEKIQLSLYIDIRKNIKLFQPLLYDMTRGEISFSYKIN